MNRFDFEVYHREIADWPTTPRANDLAKQLITRFKQGPHLTHDVQAIPYAVLLFKLKGTCTKVRFSSLDQSYIYAIRSRHEQAIDLYDTSGTLPEEWFLPSTWEVIN